MAIATCIDNFGYHDYLEEGKEYRVLSIEGNRIEIDIDKPFRTFPLHKFRIETNNGNQRSSPWGDDDDE